MTSAVVTVCVPLSLDPTDTIERIASAAGHTLTIRYRPELMPRQRFVADHRGEEGFARSEADEHSWQQLLASTEFAFGIPGDGPAGLSELAGRAPRLRWVQGTAAGTGEQLLAAKLAPSQLERLVVTSAAGIHSVPLAEFAIFGLLAFAKDLDILRESQTRHEWRPRWPMRMLSGATVVVVGLGGIGRETARLAAAMGATVIGVRRSVVAERPPGVVRSVTFDELAEVLPAADAVVLTLPGTSQTRGLFDATMLARLGSHVTLINVGRGSVIDSTALVNALDAGALRGAVLDVTDVEPLPADSPLWHRSDVIISPHTAALTVDEDNRLTDLFADNLCRILEDRPMRNVVDAAAGY